MKSALIGSTLGVLLVLGVVTSPSLLPPLKPAGVAAPAADEPPEVGVHPYLEALNKHDCDRASSLLTEPEDATGWCHRVASLDDIEISDPQKEDPAWSGKAEGDEVMRVPVRFTLTSRRFRADVSLPDGETVWGYQLTRDAQDRWRIFGQGVG